MQDLPQDEEKAEKETEQPTVEELKSLTFLKTQWQVFESVTTKKADDNLWIFGFKLLLKAIMILFLILMSPFILLIIMLSLLVAV